jgi:hypothetical protein
MERELKFLLEHAHAPLDEGLRQRDGILQAVEHDHRDDRAVRGKFDRVHSLHRRLLHAENGGR